MKNNVVYIIIITIIVILVCAGGWWLFSTSATGATNEIVESTGESTTEFANSLAAKGVIRSPLMFRVVWGWDNSAPEEGYYSLDGESLESIVEKVRQGPNITKVTFPEGFSSGQVSQRLGNRGFDANAIYDLAQPLEGKLFPETYFIPNNATPGDIINLLTSQYSTQTEGLDVSSENLIIASIVEREAKTNEERPKIAAVYKNRLEQGMNLDADPTVQYGRDLDLIDENGLMEVQLWEPLASGVVRTFQSPYNTYLNEGLPPSAISNPGVPSIEAALNPDEETTALYFFHDTDGNIHFSDTYYEHQQNIYKYGVSGS